jgi:histidyl-tRNA synthetase
MRELIDKTDTTAHATLDEWSRVIELLMAYGVPKERLFVQSDLVRDWDYYTGLVFEVRAANGDLLAGGGRYDELTRLISGERDIPAVGFACDVAMLTTHATISHQAQSTNIIIAATDAGDGVRWATKLRASGVPVVLCLGGKQAETVHIHIDMNGSAHYGDRVYTLDEPDTLADDLKREVAG